MIRCKAAKESAMEYMQCRRKEGHDGKHKWWSSWYPMPVEWE